MFMTSLNRQLLLVLGIAMLGLWGCSQSGPDARTNAAKIRQLESRNTRLEDDFRTSAADVGLLRKKLADAEKQVEDVNKQNQELQIVIKERDELQQKLSQSVGERDALRVELNGFSKELQSLTHRVQQVAGNLKSADFLTTVSQQK